MDGVHERNGLNEISGKMLETNHFKLGQFQSVISSFEPKKSFRVRPGTFGNPSLNMTKTNPRLMVLGDNQDLLRKTFEGGLTFNQLMRGNGTMLRASQSTRVL